ncbi:multicopper oxidase domain-containing protein [Methylacidiphilum fumariolicum]|nr:multicopper oxidase domain-containing protein [Candidatus Methylacidiphilum fumarolicum]MBW6415254.1 multicopper oxidase domain-containing protein [Candidatus Methylacidiphilum fumarolicum]
MPTSRLLFHYILSLLALALFFFAFHLSAEPSATSEQTIPDISRDPSDLPGLQGKRPPKLVKVTLHAIEVEGRLADGASFPYWTFNGKVPGPFLRVRVGDTLEIHLANDSTSRMVHSVDFHAAWGFSGGAAVTQTIPGQEKVFTFRALNPGLYLYHCGTPMVAQHIANGMYGLILVEPVGGLPKVDREFYIVEAEIYTSAPMGSHGPQTSDITKILRSEPEYFVFNGSVGALSRHPLRAKVGEKIRIYFGNAGPNFSSNLHLLGAVLEHVSPDGSVLSPLRENTCSLFIPAGGAGFVEFTPKVSGRYPLMDHFFARMEKGLGGELIVEGPSDPVVSHEGPQTPTGRTTQTPSH